MNLRCWIVALLITLVTGCAGPRQQRAGRQSHLIPLADSIEPLRQQFNADKDKVRVLTLFSPT